MRDRFARAGSDRPEGATDRGALLGVEPKPGGRRGRAGRLGTPRTGDRHHHRREAEQPRERDLGRARVESIGDGGERAVPCQAPGALRPAQRRMGDHGDPRLGTSLEHPAAQSTVVERAETHLDGRDRRELERLVELAAVDVADADPPRQSLLADPGQRAQRRAPRRPRIGCVEEVEVDLEAVQRDEARLASGQDGLRATVRDPRSSGSGHAALRHDPRARLGADSAQGARQQALVVPELAFVAAVGVGGVEDRYARRRSGRDRLERDPLVASVVGREAHAAEADPKLRRFEPPGLHAAYPSCQRAISSRAPALVRSRWIGVTAILPSATARKSVSGSSW